MKIAITGGAGFIGSHIADAFIEKGYRTIIIDNLSTGKTENINKRARFYKVDLRDYYNLEKIFKKERPDVVNHHAAQINARISLKKPKFDAENNIIATINLLECCRKYDVKKIIYASSCAVYGIPEKIPCNEKCKIKPINPYGLSKYCCEEYIKLYNRLYGIDFNILRYGNVFGPRQNAEGEAGVVAIFINNALKKKTCKIFGDGKQTRDFIYVKDIVDANIKALKKTESRIFNVATSKEISVNKVFEEIKKYFPKLKKKHVKAIKGEPKNVCLAIGKIKKELRWKPSYDFEKGLKETIDYFKKWNQSR